MGRKEQLSRLRTARDLILEVMKSGELPKDVTTDLNRFYLSLTHYIKESEVNAYSKSN